MKSILLSIKPEWLAKILNKEKTIEVRKKFPKDYVGWVYLYCSKSKPYLTRETAAFIYGYDNEPLNGKVVARFWCDKVEEITPYIWTPKLEQEILKGSCLTENELFKYISKNNGEQDNPFFAIYISKLEIFDRPRELSEFKRYGGLHFAFKNADNWLVDDNWNNIVYLTKAPQNYCYVEGE